MALPRALAGEFDRAVELDRHQPCRCLRRRSVILRRFGGAVLDGGRDFRRQAGDVLVDEPYGGRRYPLAGFELWPVSSGGRCDHSLD